jgi:alkylation response protein AidB-like acyl-CoA dehydrogenase
MCPAELTAKIFKSIINSKNKKMNNTETLPQSSAEAAPQGKPEAAFHNNAGVASENKTAVAPGNKTEAAPKSKAEAARPLPQPDADFYHLTDVLNEEEKKVLAKVRAFLKSEVTPIINKYWGEDSFPFEILPGFRALNIAGGGFEGYGAAGGSTLLNGFIAMELAKVDSSIATFFGVHSGLAMGSIYLGGSEEQKQKWLPAMSKMEIIGSFALTEPLVGSGTGGGLTTTARREGDTWILNGQKKWIGNATWGDITIVWARDVADNQVKGFIVENKKTPGFKTEKIQNKMALRVVQNALITMEDVRIPEENRLQNVLSFRDTAKVLRLTRAGVAWEAVGNMMGAYEHALAYAQQRQQFGKPIGKFQLVQDLLVKMLGNITASLSMVVELSRIQDAGKIKDEQASLAKAFTTVRMRESVAYAREIFGANGILLDYSVMRFFADAEALYSYEGTREMNTLIVGKAITGFSAFV